MFLEWANGSAHLFTSLTCPGVALAWPLSAQSQIQTYQVLWALSCLNIYSCLRAGEYVQMHGGQRKSFPLHILRDVSCFFSNLLCWTYEICSVFLVIWTSSELISEAATWLELSHCVSCSSMLAEGEVAPFTASSDNNDASRGLNCTVWWPRYAGGLLQHGHWL